MHKNTFIRYIQILWKTVEKPYYFGKINDLISLPVEQLKRAQMNRLVGFLTFLFKQLNSRDFSVHKIN